MTTIETLPENNVHASHARVRVVVSSFIGSVIEWYDYTIYGVAAALVFRDLFFPNFSPAAGTIAAFGSFAAGFIARPIGGIFAGHFGDRFGRKTTLVFTLVTMGVATTVIGVLPTHQQVGIWAPIALVVARLAQGFAVGGEWGGAVLMAVEHAPPNRKGLWGAWPQGGVSTGLVLGTGAFVLVSMLSNEQIMTWGWRMPFLASIALAFVGIFIRLKTEESPAFQSLSQGASVSRAPIIEVFATNRRELCFAVCARFADGGNYYIFTVFILSYVAQHNFMAHKDALLCVMGAAFLNVFASPFWGWVSDRVGRKPVFIGGALLLMIWAYPMFVLIDTGVPLFALFALTIALVFGHAAVYGPMAAYYAELFPARVRYSGVSVGYQAASIFLGGLTPMIASALTSWADGKAWPVILMIAGGGLIAAISVAIGPETYRRALDDA